ncbi:hypothetical protein MVES1_002071 [Malassezia vespertilionis]|uniref:Uncharacterized protein n=1 Tax=Malassezia vespertilionis TaxID=2020962 RepID=A0A2N1JBW9_9BASI|nr:uncharacterized protein MVES1_002071 [Malassezia vespertilionis]PKI84037.1 hypothetical protein MVES_001960 [Malassezia vespertilionis]WFD06717.1 hypothetical protein MVES1_002071 [Malassezia vespertilionis]
MRASQFARGALRAFSTSAHATRENRVSALNFMLSSESAVYRARLAALEQLLPAIKGRWGGIGFAITQALGLGAMLESEESVMRFESAQPLYYPVWIAEGIWKVKCRGDAGAAEATFVSTNSVFPGNTFKPMDTLPLRPPPLRMPEMEGRWPSNMVTTSADEPMRYESFSAARHLHPSVKLEDPITVLPFNVSPFALSDAFRNADLRTLVVDLLSEGPALHINKRISLLPGVEIQVANVSEPNEPNATAMVRIEHDSLDVKLMACYPILLPLHLVRFRYDAHGERNKLATVALGAWDANLLAYAMLSDENKAWVTKDNVSWLNIDILDFDPAVPVPKPSLDQHTEDAAMQPDARIIDLMAQQSQVQNVFEQRATDLLEHADWSACTAWEHKQGGAPSSVEAEAGLGALINWDASGILPLHECKLDTRQYIILYGQALFNARLLEGIEKDRAAGRDISTVQCLHNGNVVTGEEAIAALHERQLEIESARDANCPSWLDTKSM